MRVVLIGAGNVAHHLGSVIIRNGHRVIQVYNRTQSSAKKLSSILSCDFTTKVPEIDRTGELYIIALKDDAISEFIKSLTFSPKLIVHTSGSCSIDVFPKELNGGVLYPLQTFSKANKRTPSVIPFCIEARDRKSLSVIRKFSRSLSDMVYEKTSEEREKIHLCAVIVNNFTNHLFTLSEKILSSEQTAFDILRPLIMETALKVQDGKPSMMQTGPARRGDSKIIKEHLALLNKYPGIKKIYKTISDSIASEYDVKL
jgi:predicted short-subunit dehydrogenase-like oxidoreductase (DUF2520 family)